MDLGAGVLKPRKLAPSLMKASRSSALTNTVPHDKYTAVSPAPLLLAALLLAGNLLAQAPNVPPLVPRQPPVTSARPGQFDPDTVIERPIIFPQAEVRDVLKGYEELSGKRLIYDMQAIGQVTIEIKPPVTRGEALRIIEISLLMNGYTFVPTDDGMIKVLGQSRNPRGFGIPIISDEMQIPSGEQVITFIFKLQYADPTEIAAMLQAYLVSASSQYNQMTALPKSQALLITENSLIIRKILQIVREVDVPPAEAVSEFITLDRADAKDVLEKLEKIFEKNQQAQGGPGQITAGVPRPAQRVVTTPEGTPIPPDATVVATTSSVEISGSLSEESIIIGKIRLIADTRTNRIHVITRPVNLSFIRNLIKEYDANIPFGEPASRPLRFVSAADVFSTVVDAITEPGQKQEGGQGGGGSRDRRGTGRSTGNTGNNLLGGGNSLGGNNRDGGLGGSGAGGTGLSLSESLNTEERDSTPEARIIGNTKIIADKRANTIIVLGNTEVKAKIFALLDELDRRAPQVMLHTVIGELNLGNNRNLGVTYLANNGTNRGIFGNTTTPTGTPAPGTGTNTGGLVGLNGNNPVLNFANLVGNQNITQLVAGGAGGFSGFVAAGNAFAALVDALESSNRFKVVSRPSIFTTNNKKAIIASGEEIAVPVNITGGFSGSNVNTGGLVTQSSIQYKTVALQLEVLPLINSEKEVTLDIVQKVDQQSGSDIIDNNSIPRIATRVLQTTVTVPNEGTLVLGGLIKQSDNKTLSGIPYLSKIPVVGALFRRTTTDKVRTELIVLIRPVVTMSPPEDTRLRERSMETLNIETDLESSIYPSNVRRKTTPEDLTRRAPLRLREEDETVLSKTDTVVTRRTGK
jgi:general secretion pathway protein D